jgi:aldose 1-epimerase
VGSIGDHELQINADEFVVSGQQMTLLGRLESVVEHGNDLRRSRPLRDVIPLLFHNHGDLYLIRKTSPDILEPRLAPAARLSHPGSGRILNVSTSERYLQLYTGSGLDGSIIWEIWCSLSSAQWDLFGMRRLSRWIQCARPRRYNTAPRH